MLTGSDVASKVGTKTAALKAKPECFLQQFTEDKLSSDFAPAEKYLIKVVQPKSSCLTFDELWYSVYTSKNKTLTELPPTSAAVYSHLERYHYFLRLCFELLHMQSDSGLSPKQWMRTSWRDPLASQERNLDTRRVCINMCVQKGLCNGLRMQEKWFAVHWILQMQKQHQ